MIGFLFLAVLTNMMFKGTGELQQPSPRIANQALLDMPRKVEHTLQNHGVISDADHVVIDADHQAKTSAMATGRFCR